MTGLETFLDGSAVWGCLLTLVAFAFATFLNRKTGKAWCNTLLLAALVVIAFLSVTRIPYEKYRASAAPVSYLLLPATVSLAVPLYEKWGLLKKNALPILSGILVGALTSMGSILLLSWGMHLTPEQCATMLPKSVTTAIGVDISAELGGIPALTNALIVVTGITGNLLAEAVCRLFRITSPIAKGVGIGTASHAIGTAKALELGPTEGAMSGLAIGVAGTLTAVLAPFFMMLAK